jgi:uracil-DNA glycosylase family 4
MTTKLEQLSEDVAGCRRCERLVAWRESAAADPPRRYRGEEYWARPVPGFGDPEASIVLVGLAPAAHGANRTGRMFTGDRSGDWLFAALHRAGLASQPTSVSADDGLRLHGVYVTAPVRCAPPANKPNIVERDTCRPFMERELTLLPEAKVLLALGAYGWDSVLRTARALGHKVPKPKPRHGHGAEADVGPWKLLGSYHPSQQNTFTGRLTEEMLDDVMARAKELAGPRT